MAARKVRELAQDMAAVECELSKYEAAGALASYRNTGMVNVVEFWSVNNLLYYSDQSFMILEKNYSKMAEIFSFDLR